MAEMSAERVAMRVPEARYAYYRRCQIFRKGGEQCKAPAEKGSHTCHAHAGQLATAVRRERERRAVLEEAVFRMRKSGKPECEIADLFMDFNGIQVTLAVMAQAVIHGRIDCKTAGRLVVQLQTVSKLLRVYHRGHREAQRTTTALTTKDTRSTSLSQAQGRSGQATEHKALPQICADERSLGRPVEKAHLTREARRHAGQPRAERDWTANDLPLNQREEIRIALVGQVRVFADRRGWGHAPPELLRAA
jgi:hypothetical protein